MPKIRSRSGFLRVGGYVDEVHAALTFNGPNLDPDALTKSLRCRPSDAHARGQECHVRGTAYRRRAGHWSLDARPWKKEDLAHAIDRLLRKVKANAATVREIAGRFQGRVFCGIETERWNRSFDIPASTLTRVAALGLSLGIDIYANQPNRLDWSRTLRSGNRRNSRSLRKVRMRRDA